MLFRSEILWGVAHPSDMMLQLWNPQKQAAGPNQAGVNETGAAKSDSYSMYVKIMKSVAEIMNEA